MLKAFTGERLNTAYTLPIQSRPPIQAAYLIPNIRNLHSQRPPDAILLLIPSSRKRITTPSHRDTSTFLSLCRTPACHLEPMLFAPFYILAFDFYKLHTSVLPRLEAGSVFCTLVDKCRVDGCNGNGWRTGRKGRGSECLMLSSMDLVGFCVKMGC